MAQTRSQNKTAAKQNDIHRNKKPRVFADEPPSANETTDLKLGVDGKVEDGNRK